jgi:ribonuclease HI
MEGMISRFWWGSNVDKKKIHWVSWKKNCQQKEMGGVGFRDLHKFNTALLAKQGWRILTNPSSLMAGTLKAKYFPNTDFLQAKQCHKSSYTWQSILKASWVLKRGCSWLVGNGQSINIWSDNWIHHQIGSKTWSPKPDNTDLQKVCDLFDPLNNTWKEDIIQQTFFPYEANQIRNIPLTYTMDEDVPRWLGTKDGEFTVRSGYYAIMEWNRENINQGQQSSTNGNTHIWKKLWSLPNPPKQIHLMWRILHQAIPVKTNLHAKGISCDTLCPICQQDRETIDHLLMNCEWSKRVWFSSPLTIQMNESGAKSFKDWVTYMMDYSSKECMQIIITITYSIWLSRNKKVFENRSILESTVIDNAIRALQDYQIHLKPTPITSTSIHASTASNNIRRSPPPGQNLVLSVDAHLSDDGHWGLGIVLCRTDGLCVGAATKLIQGSGTVELAETIGLCEALAFIESNNLRQVNIHMDAANIVKAINSRSFPRSHWGQMARLNGITLSWILRRDNEAAHSLARWAKTEPNMCWTTNFPYCIKNLVLTEKANVT